MFNFVNNEALERNRYLVEIKTNVLGCRLNARKFLNLITQGQEPFRPDLINSDTTVLQVT